MTSLRIITACMLFLLFWYGYTYSLTTHAFAIEGYLGACIPLFMGMWLAGYGFVEGLHYYEGD